MPQAGDAHRCLNPARAPAPFWDEGGIDPTGAGVDDWGFQRKCPTGTLLVDLEKHRVVDLLMGSDVQVFKEWLQAHAGVEVISRDRGASYRIGATAGAPAAQQVLDRWHLLVRRIGACSIPFRERRG